MQPALSLFATCLCVVLGLQCLIHSLLHIIVCILSKNITTTSDPITLHHTFYIYVSHCLNSLQGSLSLDWALNDMFYKTRWIWSCSGSLQLVLIVSLDLVFFFQSVLYWSIAVSTICRHSSRVVAFLQAVARPKIRGPRSASIAQSQVWLGLPVGQYLSDTRCKGSVVVLAR